MYNRKLDFEFIDFGYSMFLYGKQKIFNKLIFHIQKHHSTYSSILIVHDQNNDIQCSLLHESHRWGHISTNPNELHNNLDLKIYSFRCN